MDKVNCFTKMEINTMDNLKMVKNMEKVNIQEIMDNIS